MVPYWFIVYKNFYRGSYSVEESAQTLVEYALILALIAILLIAVLTLLGVNISGTFGTITNALENANGYP